ncbi:hypothetical protein V8G57_08920 [Collimonas sp. H4R21]|uniref:Uncharacterized protein n=1 Tax=Collimonas rhizosphaerae TaxID=3126357 RepID=A0ABU9PU33_9BURK
MGTSSTSLFADDVASDVRDEFTELLVCGASAADATQSLVQSWSIAINDVDDGPTFWLALAATQWKYGCLVQEVQTRAIDVIESGRDLNKWSGAPAIRRSAVLSALKDKLLSPQLPSRRPRRRKIVAVPSIKVPSPDGRGLATAFEITPSSALTTPQMQVWAYTTRPGESDSTLTVLKIEQYKDLGQVIHVRIDGIRMRNPLKGNIVTDIPHLPFRSAAIQRSVTKLLRRSSSVPNFKEGYDTWREAYDAGKAGAFETDVAATLNALLGAAWEEKK